MYVFMYVYIYIYIYIYIYTYIPPQIPHGYVVAGSGTHIVDMIYSKTPVWI